MGVATAPSTPTVSSNAMILRWPSDSPVPYLFLGIAFVFLVIAVAVLVLACSRCRMIARPPAAALPSKEKPGTTTQMRTQEEVEPRIVVVMAGDDRPLFLANPISLSLI
ncbi:protein GLUTAMINE DUMPER 2-like [Carya illinoinensis]|nr:protein GLUTAMINE DUMPER 2-like [Carya illinoinensis]